MISQDSLPQDNLLVVEYSGSARSGKGSIVQHITQKYAWVASEETGIDYRLLTKRLLADGHITPRMGGEVIDKAIGQLSPEYLKQVTANRDNLINMYGREAFYANNINNLVAEIGKVKKAREAVKHGFTRRVIKIRDSKKTKVLVIDGRNLSEVIRAIDGTKVLLRTYVDCQPLEAALRECERKGIEFDSPEGLAILESIKARNDKDAKRKIDPLRADADAIPYWDGPVSNVLAAAKPLLDSPVPGDYLGTLAHISQKFPVEHINRGVGTYSVSSGRQIYFDTTPFRLYRDSKAAMLYAAEVMFEEALTAA